ncbi:RluA family pseudouridine synthase [Agrilactobacillus composti DSM 18527 = JCM 14202]|uniref:Pseudouridine synthase n=1 Tax=Agrilactobacillus composti DSM 18527 = JCM 14202 TaxID=1423734 RepID=X0PDW6_9LACO|nr:RluA family pseudouridine synthase [Agrilactobacillus composti]KRM31115.1 RluA family pseudouridine synthase [Agrilactobacillus composti DSM 18527 = JCM 14202]GAF39499.1 ribosomal large subunit pseudouridine synthase D [Agrilactobacillus composti DSM 18527 = JCM 14202]
MQFSWFVPQAYPKVALGKFLHQQGLSRTLFGKTKYHGGSIYVNHHQRYSNYPIYPGDQITIAMAPERDSENLPPVFKPLQILFEDEHYLIVYKPAGLPSIPSRHYRHDSVANRVKGHLIQVAHESRAVHVITRLDQDTSGCMLFAKHSFAHALMAKQLHSQTLEKTYLAIAKGQFATQQGQIDQPIGRIAPYSMQRMVHFQGKKALTKYWVVQQYPTGALLRVALLTGRTHQIRVHLDWLGHPLFGDPMYGPKDDLLDRQALHCVRLRFLHPFTNQIVDVSAPLPADMGHLLTALAK